MFPGSVIRKLARTEEVFAHNETFFALAVDLIGPVVAAGWLASTAAVAVAGGATGGLIGALTQSGIGEEEAHAERAADVRVVRDVRRGTLGTGPLVVSALRGFGSASENLTMLKYTSFGSAGTHGSCPASAALFDQERCTR